ncbi:MAG TPA: hypothetical protein VMS17_10655, partial [Gemmataceae bacterium]|nr:hypothetical protein [Gemmataceae bacterium]
MIGSQSRRRWIVAAVLLMLLSFGAPVRAASLNSELQDHAKQVLDFLQAHDCRNVGVLRFQAKVGDAPVPANAGSIHQDVADRLTVALILADDLRRPIGVVRDASRRAAELGVKDLKQDDLPKLFTGAYPLAWGDQTATPDGFLTGEVEVQKDLLRMTVHIQYIDRDAKRTPVLDVEADTQADDPVRWGDSYALRGVGRSARPNLSDAQTVQNKVVQAAQAVKAGTTPHPLDVTATDTPETPVALEVHFGDKQVVKYRDGKAVIDEEPQEGQAVKFILKRTSAADPNLTYGVVLKVNGINTASYQQRFLDNRSCRKWILKPGAEPMTIDGFQVDKNRADGFTVKNVVNDDNPDLGTINLAVFPEAEKSESDPRPPKLVAVS